MQISQDVGSGTEQDRVTGLSGGMRDILGNHRFSEAVSAHQDQVASFGDEVQSERAFDRGTVDFGGPVPIEVGHGFKATDAGVLKAPLQGTAGAFLEF